LNLSLEWLNEKEGEAGIEGDTACRGKVVEEKRNKPLDVIDSSGGVVSGG